MMYYTMLVFKVISMPNGNTVAFTHLKVILKYTLSQILQAEVFSQLVTVSLINISCYCLYHFQCLFSFTLYFEISRV